MTGVQTCALPILFCGTIIIYFRKKPICPGNTKRLTDKDRQKYLTQDVINLVERKERLLFKICADHGAKYDPPAEARYKS